MQQYGAIPAVVRYGSLEETGKALFVKAISEDNAGGGDIQRLLARYDELENIVRSHAMAGSMRATAENRLHDAERAYTVNQAELSRVHQAKDYTARKYNRNAHPDFFHKLQFHLQDKVKRLEHEVADLEAKERDLTRTLQNQETDLQVLRADLSRLQAEEATEHRARAEQQQIFEQVVGMMPGSQVQSLQYELGQAEGDHRANSMLLGALQSTMSQIQQARQLFGQAHQELIQASQDNQMAKFEAEVDMFTDRREDFFEMSLQQERDRLLNIAKQTAFNAGRMLQAAFDSFPMEARVRYPDLTRNLCNAPIPDLSHGNFSNALTSDFFFGSWGAFANDLRQDGKINRNMNILQQCEQLALAQAQSVQIVLSQIHATQQSLENRCNSIKSSLDAEKLRLFQSARARYPAQSVPTAVATATVPSYSSRTGSFGPPPAQNPSYNPSYSNLPRSSVPPPPAQNPSFNPSYSNSSSAYGQSRPQPVPIGGSAYVSAPPYSSAPSGNYYGTTT